MNLYFHSIGSSCHKKYLRHFLRLICMPRHSSTIPRKIHTQKKCRINKNPRMIFHANSSIKGNFSKNKLHLALLQIIIAYLADHLVHFLPDSLLCTLAAYDYGASLARFAHFCNFFIVFSQIYGEDVEFSKRPNWVLRKYRFSGFSELNGLARAQKSSRQYWLFYAKNVAFF